MQQEKNIKFVIFVAILVCLTSCSGVSSRIGKINDREARQLVEVALNDLGYDTQSSKFELDEETDKYFPDYYQFGASYDTPTRFARIGTYKVASRSAEVWDVMSCKIIYSRSVTKMQKFLRTRYGLPTTSKHEKSPCDAQTQAH